MSFNLSQKIKFNINKKLIFYFVAALAIQQLVMIILYGNNWSVELILGLPITSGYFVDNNYPYEMIFKESDSHLHIFSRIPFLLSFFFDNFNTKTLLYFGWALFSTSIYFFYAILKRIDERAVWILVPISAFVYNPIQYFTVLWAHAFFVYGIPFLTTILMAYFLNKTILDKKSYLISLFIGTIAAFSHISGIIVLLSGLLPLVYKKEKNKLAIWIVCTSLVIATYLYSWSGRTVERFLFIPEKQFLTFLKLIAIPYTVKLDFLYTVIGVLMIAMFIVSFVIVKKHYKLGDIIPWMQMMFVAFFVSIMITLGRGGVAYYYSTLTSLFAIGGISFIGLFFLARKFSIRNNLMLIFILGLIIQLILLTPSYYMGWKLANDFNIYENKRNSCFSLNPDNELCNSKYYDLSDSGKIEMFKIMNGFLEQKKGIFYGDLLNKKAIEDQEFFNNLPKMEYSGHGYGQIVFTNIDANTETVVTTDPIITLSGWITDNEKEPVDYLFIIANDKPLTKISQFGTNNNKKTDNHPIGSTWNISFLSGYLEEECNKITVIGFKDTKKVIIDSNIIICKDLTTNTIAN